MLHVRLSFENFANLQKLEDDMQGFDLKIKHHEANLEFLKSQSNSLDKSIKDLEGLLAWILLLYCSVNLSIRLTWLR